MTTLNDPHNRPPFPHARRAFYPDGRVPTIGDVLNLEDGEGVIVRRGSMAPLIAEGANAHGIGPDTAGGPNPLYRHQDHANVGAGGGDEDSMAVAPKWLPQPRPTSEVLANILNRAELEENQAKDRAAREKVEQLDREKLIGGQRRRQVLRSVILRIGKDLGNEKLGAAALADFDSELADDVTLGSMEPTACVPMKLSRPQWSPIIMDVDYDDAGEARPENARAWIVWRMRAVSYRGDGDRVRMERDELKWSLDSFAAACLVAQREGANAIKIAYEQHREGKEVIWA